MTPATLRSATVEVLAERFGRRAPKERRRSRWPADYQCTRFGDLCFPSASGDGGTYDANVMEWAE